MNIAFDIDGVFTDLHKFILEYGKKFFLKKYGKDIVDKNACSIKKMFDCSDKQEYEFWKKHLVYYALKWPMRDGMAEVIKKLQEDGNNVFTVSSRIKTFDNDPVGVLMRHLLKAWFKKNGVNIKDENFKFCPLENTPIAKRKVCEENKIDLMVEDDVENIDEISKVTEVVGFKNVYNEHLDNVTLTDSAYELYDIISKKNTNTKFRYLKYKERSQLSRSDLIKYYSDLKDDYRSRDTMMDIDKTEKTYLHVYSMLKKIFDSKYPSRVENEYLNPNEDGIIYVINHRSMLDCPLAMSAIGKKPIHMLLKAEFLETKVAGFLKSLGSVFVKRGVTDSEIAATEELTKLVLNKRNILICPEGTRNKTDAPLLPFKKGAVSIAQKTGRPIVPIAIIRSGDEIILRFGEKINVDIFDDLELKNEELMESFHQLLMNNEITNFKR